jgi:hypothetical protein
MRFLNSGDGGPVFEREDWTLFRNLETLGQKAGVAKDDVPKLVAKELADNACDAAGSCKLGLLPAGGMYVEDEGDGIPGGAEGIGKLFSINRPLYSSKLIRLPTRGALGNGLRVVCGAVLSTGGRMVVATRGGRYRLQFQDDGTTVALRLSRYTRKGTRIEVWLGEGPWQEGGFGSAALEWARRTVILASAGTMYGGRSSAHWYDSDSFYELVQAAGTLTVRELVGQFEGCSGERAGEIASIFFGRRCASLTREEAEELLGRMRDQSRVVNPKRLGAVGIPQGYPDVHYRTMGTFTRKPSRGDLAAEIPYVVEAWARPATSSSMILTVNRTPATAELEVYHQKTELQLFGCGLENAITVGRSAVEILLNVESPYMPITTDGKAPNLRPLLSAVETAISKAARRARRGIGGPSGKNNTKKARIEASLEEAINQASGDHQHTYSLRQLYYVVRPMVADGSKELQYNNFTKVVGDYETAHGPFPGMYRDPRGILYHPHLHEEIQLGTRAVDGYARPAWTFNKILYCEKEGIVSILRQARWPERHDCALLTGKGYASRAVRDLLDLLGETEEELLFFAVHDADAAGTMIYQALQEETAARGARKVKVINLGLEPWEATGMGLPVEPVERKGKKTYPVAEYVHEREDGKEWNKWLQHNRIELNAMTTPQLIAWLDKKMQEFGQGRLIPSADVVADHLEQQVHAQVEVAVRDTILKENDFTGRVETEFKNLLPKVQRQERGLPEVISRTLEQQEHEHLSWAAVVDGVAIRLTKPST